MPDLPSLATQVRGLSLPERLTRAIEELQQFLRVRGGLLPGDGLDAYISRRDLVQWGFATSDLAVGGTPGPGTGPIVPVPVTGNEPDYTPPPVPTGVTALGGYTSVFVKWAPVVDRRIGYFEVWRAAVDDVGEAVKIGQTTSFLYIDEVQTSDSFFYWVRSVNAWDDEVTSAFNAVAGTAAQTAPDVGYAIEVLTGALGEQPFFEITEPTTIGGVVFAPGVYIKDLFVKKAIAEVFVAGLAVIDDASIKNVTAGKILADKLGVGQYIEAQNYVAGSSGWRINANGTAEFSGVVVRGTVYASAGLIGGLVIGSTYVQSAGYVAGTSGFRLNSDGSVEIRNLVARGDILASSVAAGISVTAPQIIGGTVQAAAMFGGSYSAAYAWPVSNSGGFHLSAAGLLIGNWNGSTGNYAYIDAQGNADFSNLTARGNIEASTLKVNAANIVSTLHLQGEAVTIPRGQAALTDGYGVGANITVDNAIAGKRIILMAWAAGGSIYGGGCELQRWNGSAWETLAEELPRLNYVSDASPGWYDGGTVVHVYTPTADGNQQFRVMGGGSGGGYSAGVMTSIAAIQGKR